MRNLIPMIDFVLERAEDLELANPELYKEELLKIVSYANLLQQPLTIEMFVPCDEQIFEGVNPENARRIILNDSSLTVESLIKYKVTLTKFTYEKYF